MTVSARVRTAFRVLAVVLVALAAFLLFLAYLDARRKGQWNYESNLWVSLVTASIGVLGWLFPRVVGWVTLPVSVLWFLWAIAYEGVSAGAVVVGGVPLAVSVLFVLSGRPKRARGSKEPVPGETS